MYISNNPNNELEQSIVQVPDLVQIPEEIHEMAQKFQEAMMMYTCAIREVKTKLEVLNDELSVKNRRNPIEVIKSRVKKPKSIVEKLKRRGLPLTLDSIVNNLDDVAGIRVICSFLDDIYEVADMLTRQDDVNLIAVKDDMGRYYIEIQLRTIAMDFWASLDHQLKYKKDFIDSDDVERQLKECADVIANTDQQMLNIRQSIESRGIEVRKPR